MVVSNRQSYFRNGIMSSNNVFLAFLRINFYFFTAIVNFFRQFIAPKKKDITGEIVLITGAGSGIGQLMCVEFARIGAIVVAWDINAHGLAQTAEKVKKSTGQTIHTFECDVSSFAHVKKMASVVRENVGDVGILVNNAGIVNGTTLIETSDEDIDRVFKINTLAHFYTVKTFLPNMLKRGRGHLVFLASCAGMIGLKRGVDYSASKAANLLMADSLRSELEFTPEHKGKVAITTVAPFLIGTGMFDGCKGLLPWILPELKPDYVVQRIIAAVLTEQALLAIPRIVHMFAILNTIFPTFAMLHLLEISGAHRFMDYFKGRKRL